MQDRTLARDIARHEGKDITLCGWVHRIRELGGISFVLLRDRSGIAQIVASKAALEGVQQECVVRVSGRVEKNDKAPFGAELHNPAFEVLSRPAGELPIAIHGAPESMNIDALLNNRILSLRIPKIRAIFEVQSVLLRVFETHLRTLGFTEIKTSKLISSGTEGGTGLFEVSYFDTRVFLAQSPQFYKQAGIASGLERVFEIGPVYRAEKHETNRHLNEYVSMDIEMAFIDSPDALMDVQLGFLQAASEAVLSECGPQLAEWGAQVIAPEALAKTPRLSYDEAKAIAAREGGERVLDIDPAAERTLCDWAQTQFGAAAVFVHGFPKRKRPFYTMPDGQKTKGFDMLYGGVEISTGGLRIHDYALLCENAEKFGLRPEALEDYLSIFKYGCPPHGGFAIGLERLTQKMLGLPSVKLASMFPRDRSRTTP